MSLRVVKVRFVVKWVVVGFFCFLFRFMRYAMFVGVREMVCVAYRVFSVL